MEELKEMVVKKAITQNKNPLSPSQIALIHQHLHQEFPLGLRTPKHPTYASMITKAIAGLDEEGGSIKSSISKYIKQHFEDLPWGHSNFLNLHLTKLCDEGVIMLKGGGRYSISLLNQEQQTRSVNKTSSCLGKNELVEVQVHGSGDEHLNCVSEIEVLILNLGGKKRKAIRRRAR